MSGGTVLLLFKMLGASGVSGVSTFPGATTASRIGPGATTASRIGPGATTASRIGPGATTASRKIS